MQKEWSLWHVGMLVLLAAWIVAPKVFFHPRSSFVEQVMFTASALPIVVFELLFFWKGRRPKTQREKLYHSAHTLLRHLAFWGSALALFWTACFFAMDYDDSFLASERMPVTGEQSLKNTATIYRPDGTPVEVPDDQVLDALASGQYGVPKGTKLRMVNQEGAVYEMDPAEAVRLAGEGWQYETAAIKRARALEKTEVVAAEKTDIVVLLGLSVVLPFLPLILFLGVVRWLRWLRVASQEQKQT